MMALLLCAALASAAAVVMTTAASGADQGSGRVLVVQVDNRGLVSEGEEEGPNANKNLRLATASYSSLTPVLNHHYCRRHGYDYLLVQPVVDVARIMASLGGASSLQGFDNSSTDGRQGIGALHKGLGQVRAASWAKLPVLLYLMLQLGGQYDRVWYLDSDLGISDQPSGGRALADKLAEWASGSKCLGPPRNSSCVTWGLPDVHTSPMLLFPNSPFGDLEPCAGTFMLRPQAATSMLLDWWDVDMPSKNFGLMHEQDALWNLTSGDRVKALLLEARAAAVQGQGQGTQTQTQTQGRQAPALAVDPSRLSRLGVTLLQEFQFPQGRSLDEKREQCVGGKQWLCHLITTDGEQRAPFFRQMLARPENGAYDQQRYRAALRHIQQSLLLRMDMAKAAEVVERYRAALRGNKLAGAPLAEADRLELPRGLLHARPGAAGAGAR